MDEVPRTTVVPEREIHRVRRKYRALVSQEAMSKSEFFSIPGAGGPLCHFECSSVSN
jgi:hypothetical protein